MARVVLIRHGHERDNDRIVTYFRNKGIEPETIRPFDGDDLGDVGDDVIASAIYGGEFNVFDEEKHKFLHDENRWIKQCIEKNIPLLGVCQSAQSIARVLGADVGPKPGGGCEFGYYPIHPTVVGKAYFPDDLIVPQAHFHEFHTPVGAELLAASAAFGQQAFKYGDNVFAFQFHPEVTQLGFKDFQQVYDLYSVDGAQTPSEQARLMAQHDLPLHRWFMAFQESLFGPSLAATLS